MLDIFSNENFPKVLAALALMLLIATTMVAGPPPSDSQCTLPWC